ncbi:hypothetical protein APICC_05585 [Apis cerana cerana]|uniref:Uncharacterized protein n=1 Tax=Apis cerana cerana TaxID=94128 RepID=A0A2A3EJX3_APICC|nr:hypothetical protein APICC_05585 [Apis cerana cerana]
MRVMDVPDSWHVALKTGQFAAYSQVAPTYLGLRQSQPLLIINFMRHNRATRAPACLHDEAYSNILIPRRCLKSGPFIVSKDSSYFVYYAHIFLVRWPLLRRWPCYGDLEHWGTSSSPPLFVGCRAVEGGQTLQEVCVLKSLGYDWNLKVGSKLTPSNVQFRIGGKIKETTPLCLPVRGVQTIRVQRDEINNLLNILITIFDENREVVQRRGRGGVVGTGCGDDGVEKIVEFGPDIRINLDSYQLF